MSKQLTPMQELIEYLEKYKEVIGMTAVMIIDKAKSLLPAERKMVEDAANACSNVLIVNEIVINGNQELTVGENYFTQKYQS